MKKSSPKLRKVAIIGVGSTPFGKLTNDTIVSMSVSACEDAISDSNLAREEIEAVYLGNYVGERLASEGVLAPKLANRLGITGVPTTKVEGACASGGLALRQAFLSVALGLHNFVLAVGVEKMTTSPTDAVTSALATAGDTTLEMRTGLTFPGSFAMIMQAHMAKYGTTREQVAMVSVKNHENGINNDKAMFRKATNIEEVITSRSIAEPIRLFDCPPITDGAAAAILCPMDIAHQFVQNPIELIGSGHASGPVSLTQSDDITSFSASVRAANEAYKIADLTPQYIDVAEVHDCFTIAEIVAIEDLGFFPKGTGGPATEQGSTGLNGEIAVNPSGGLLAKGHPVGATGLAQAYEIVQQLRETSSNQVDGATVGLAHNLGGSGAVATVNIFKKV